MTILKRGAALLSLFVATANAEAPQMPELEPVSQARLDAGTTDTTGWVMYGGNYENWRYSPLTDIDRDNVGKLVPTWLFQTGIPGQLAGAPIVADGVVYLTASYNHLYALDAKSGEPLWHYEHQMPSDLRICCGPVNRGVAIAGDHVFMATLDARLIAFERATGKIAWNIVMDDHKVGYSATSAPVVIDDLVISGIAGGEYGARGFVDAYDIKTGEVIAHHYSDPRGFKKPQRILADQIIHGFKTLRPGQLRGISDFVSGVLVTRDLQECMEGEIDGFKFASKWLQSPADTAAHTFCPAGPVDDLGCDRRTLRVVVRRLHRSQLGSDQGYPRRFQARDETNCRAPYPSMLQADFRSFPGRGRSPRQT